MASEDKNAWVNQRLESHRRAQQVSAASETTPSYRSGELLGAVEDTVTVLGEKETPGEPKLLWVGDLGYEVTDELLKAAFTQFGHVERAWVERESIPASDTAGRSPGLSFGAKGNNPMRLHKSLGYGFVEFSHIQEAVDAQEVCNQQFLFLIGGSPRPVRVEFAETLQERLRQLEPDTHQCYNATTTTEGTPVLLTFDACDSSQLDIVQRKYARKLQCLFRTQQAEEERLQEKHLKEHAELFDSHDQIIQDGIGRCEKINEMMNMVQPSKKGKKHGLRT